MASYRFGVRDAKVAKWTSINNYGTLVDLTGVSSMDISVETTTADLEGDDTIVATHAQPVRVRITVRFAAGATMMDAFEVLTGETATTSGSDERIVFDDGNYPYIGLVAQVYEVEGTGDQVLSVPKCKLTSGFTYGARYGGFITPEITLTGVMDGANGFFILKDRAVATALTGIIV